MFTGIIENTGIVKRIEKENSNLNFWLKCDFTHELSVDQSLAHNGVCLTVVEIQDTAYRVTAVHETLNKSNLRDLTVGSIVNLERCMRLNERLDGHIVQGHVDQTGTLASIENQGGSRLLWFVYAEDLYGHVTVSKGSVCVNGISLTVVNSEKGKFSVAVIPYTWEHTNLKLLKTGDKVNLEFDIIGKYVQRLMNKA